MIRTPHSEIAIEATKRLQEEQLHQDPRITFYDQAYKQQNTVWDIGQPQPEMARILSERENDIKSTVLDIGCGTGEHVLFMGKRGFHGMGVDSSEKAIEEATNKAKERGLADRVTFKVWDCRQLAKLDQRFDIIIDSGFSHILPVDQRLTHTDILRSVMKPGGRLYILSCAHKMAINSSSIRERKMPSGFFIHGIDQPTKQQFIETIPITSEEEFIVPPGMTKQDIYQLYSKQKGWRVDSIQESRFDAATGEAAPALLSVHVITYVGDQLQAPSAIAIASATTSSK